MRKIGRALGSAAYDLGLRALTNPALRPLLAHRYATHRFHWCRLKLKLGLQVPTTFVQWLATYRCNFRCEHCEASAAPGGRARELTTDEAIALVEDIARMGAPRLFVSGGEPLLRPDLFEILGRAAALGLRYGIASNGFLVARHRESLAALPRPPYTYFTSIDGLEATNDAFRGQPGAFRETLAALTFFERIGVPTRTINTAVHPGNLDQLEELERVFRASAATSWRLALMIPVGRARANEALFLDDAQTARVLRFVARARRAGRNVRISEDAGYLGRFEPATRPTPFFCGAGLTRCSVMPDGEVLGCQIVYDERCSEGNVRQRPLSEIWREGFRRFREPRIEDEECRRCGHLASCRSGCWGMRLAGASAPGDHRHHCRRRAWDPCR